MSRFSIEATFSAIDRITAPVTKMERATRQLSTGIKRDFMSAQARMDNFGQSIKSGIGNAVTYGVVGAGIALGYLAKRGLDLASDLTEVQNVVDTTFGKQGADVINSWSNTALKNFGLSELQAKQFSSTIGAMVKPSGLASDQILQMSQDMAGLAGDFASFYNIPIEEAFNKIRSGISGETEPLKQLGKDMSVASLEAFALTQGITKQFQAMSQAEKYQLRYNYLMKSSVDQIGDFNKTLKDSYANQLRMFTVQVDQLSARVMSALLPTMLEGVTALNQFVASVDAKELGTQIKSIADTVIYLVTALYNMRYILGISIGLWYAYRIGMNTAAVALWLYNGAMTAFNIAKVVALALFSAETWALGAYNILMGAATIKAAAFTAGQWLLNAALTANPIGVIVIAVAALVGWFAYLVSHTTELNKQFLEMTSFLDNPVVNRLLGVILGGGTLGTMMQIREQINQGSQSETGGNAPRREVQTQGQQIAQSVNTNRNINTTNTNSSERLVKIKIDNMNGSALTMADSYLNGF